MLKPEDIAAIFEWIELLLIASLKRNLARHKEEEEQEGFTWSAWQAEKLRSINIFRRQCSAIMDRYKDQIDDETRQLLEEQFEEGVNGAVKELEEAHAQTSAPRQETPQKEAQPSNEPEAGEAPEPVSFQVPAAEPTPEITPETIIKETDPEEPLVTATVTPEPQFFGVDKAKTEKLIEDVTNIEKQVETAALRMTDDVYRQTVNRVQLAMATGSITYEKAVDMAVADFLTQGINCIEYSNGRRVNIADYVRMVLRTTSTRATLQGKSAKYKAQGYDTVQVSSYGMCSKTCEPWQGRIYIEDTFSDWNGDVREQGGILWGKSNYCGKWFPLLSSAIEKGLFHPNCRHSINLWRDGDPLPESVDNTDSERRYKEEQHQRALEREVRKAKRKVEGSLAPDDVKKAKAELQEAQKNVRDYINETNAAEGERVLVRNPIQEKIYGEAPPRIGSSADPYEPPKKRVQSTEGFAAEVNIPAPENQNAEYTEQKIPERFMSAGADKGKAVEPAAEVEAGNVDNQSIDNSEKSGTIDIEVDEFVPCLKDAETGEILPTEVARIPRKRLREFTEADGWGVDWKDRPKDEYTLGVFLKGDDAPQGLISLKPVRGGLYMAFASTAPHNNKQITGGKKKYIGVGGHLFAAAVKESLRLGHNGAVYGFAKNEELLRYYIREFGAIPAPVIHQFQFFIADEAAQNLIDTYNYERR